MKDIAPNIYNWDLTVFKAIHIGWHSSLLDPFFLLCTCFGDGGWQTVIVLVFLISPMTRRYFWPLLASLVFGGIAGADLIKALLPRDRPSLLSFAHPQEAWKYTSFPSGHTTSAFAIAVTLTLITHGTKRAWWGYLALGISVLVGISRIYRGVHWPTDVIGGLFCGTAFGILVYLAFKRAGYKFEAEALSSNP
jgi:undecaprenyl-diphosphatase